MTLTGMLDRNAQNIPEKTAIVFHDTRICYRELGSIVNKMANALLDMGLKKGDMVGLMLPRIPELVISFLAVARAGGIAVPVNFELKFEDLETIFRCISPRFLVVYGQFLDLAKRVSQSDPRISIIAVDGAMEGSLQWNHILKSQKGDNPCHEIKDDDIVYLNYTSGSTGNHKGAITTHSNIYWNTLASVDALGLMPGDVHLCMFAPFAHPHEIFARSLYLGGTMVLVDKIYPKSLADAISTHRVTCMMGLAPMYQNLLDLLEHKDYDLSSLLVPESGGMYTRRDLIEKFRQKVGVPMIPVWGSTETTGIAIANRPGEDLIPGSIGRPCDFYEINIVDECGEELEPGEIGEMVFKGPAVIQGYYMDEANSKKCLSDGWYHSGDLGRKDESGHFYFVERKAGLMKVAGLKVYPLEIELVLMDHPDIKEAAVISAKDRLRGEVPKALIVTKDGRELTEKEILGFCKGRLAQYKLPRIIEIRESLPKIGSGKINKMALQMEHA